ncbi:MAG: hypothetical protein KDI50_13400 [Candidatus Competibacteraceae bacterium]|nr:hypothetical protein [Candidatus Competibacteraceae bacterium]
MPHLSAVGISGLQAGEDVNISTIGQPSDEKDPFMTDAKRFLCVSRAKKAML